MGCFITSLFLKIDIAYLMSTTSIPIIVMRKINRRFFVGKENEICVLRDIELEISAGSFVVIRGPSGSGKSTLLYLLGGLDRPTQGEMYVNGNPLVDEVSLRQPTNDELAYYRRKMVGFVFQTFYLIPNMTALENVAFPLRVAGIPRSGREASALKSLMQVGLQNRARSLASNLSGGEKQRVAIARALIFDPQIVLADEPTGNLDRQNGDEIIKILVNLHKQGKTIIMVTHDDSYESKATQVVYLQDGKIVESLQ